MERGIKGGMFMKYNKATEMQGECELNPEQSYPKAKEITPKDAEWWDAMAKSFRDGITTLIDGMTMANDRLVRRNIGNMLGDMIGLYKDAVETGTTIAATELLKNT
jgi:hypothetical protein